MTRKFTRTIEDFTCTNCKTKVKGNGYTNHCPNCLWSAHVDINPGDRANPCKSPMKPIHAFFKNNQWHIVHQCQKCLEQKNVKTTAQDNLEKIEEVIKN